MEILLKLIKEFGAGFVLLAWFLIVIEPRNKKTTDSLIKGLKELSIIINSNKKYNLKDFLYIARVSVENTIMRIYKRINIIIDKNSIVENLDEIVKEVSIIIDREVNQGREYLIIGGFEKTILDNFFENTDKMKEIAKKEITKSFNDFVVKLYILNEEKKNLRTKYIDCKNLIEFILELEESNRLIRNEYITLKRKIWQIFETILSNVEIVFNQFERG